MRLHALAAEKTRATNRGPKSVLVLFCFEGPMKCFISTTTQTWASCTRSMLIIWFERYDMIQWTLRPNSDTSDRIKSDNHRTAGRFPRLAATMRLRLRCGAVYKCRPQDARGGVRQGVFNELIRLECLLYVYYSILFDSRHLSASLDISWYL